MRDYQIEIDEEVMNYLKNFAEPFEDTPNSVLRRLLLQKNQNSANLRIGSKIKLPEYPIGTSVALQQILEVIYLVKRYKYTRTSATNYVAKYRNTAPQTVFDKYCRQLDKKAHEIDYLFEDSNLNELKNLLENKFPNSQEVVNTVFEEIK